MPSTTRSKDGNRASVRRSPLSRGRIVTAALALADARGDFSMRALGQKLRVDPMAIYRHFRDKQAVLDAMVDVALAKLRPPPADAGSPTQRLRQMSIDLRAALAAHPGVAARVSSTRPTLGPHTVSLTEASLGLLFDMGLDAAEATRAYLMLIRFITGVAVAEEQVRANGTDEAQWKEELRAAYASLPATEFPSLRKMAEQVSQLGFQEEFEYGLDLLLAALAQKAGSAPG